MCVKVLARIANATRPTIHLCEVVSEQQLERLLLLLVGTDFNRGDISWGGAWAQYSLTCMLQDILAGRRRAFPPPRRPPPSTQSGLSSRTTS